MGDDKLRWVQSECPHWAKSGHSELFIQEIVKQMPYFPRKGGKVARA
jgi:hypothetical protein